MVRWQGRAAAEPPPDWHWSRRYLHAEFKSALLGFVDDVQFMADPAAGVIHMRSASRVGYSDLGANRKRVENIRALAV